MMQARQGAFFGGGVVGEGAALGAVAVVDGVRQGLCGHGLLWNGRFV